MVSEKNKGMIVFAAVALLVAGIVYSSMKGKKLPRNTGSNFLSGPMGVSGTGKNDMAKPITGVFGNYPEYGSNMMNAADQAMASRSVSNCGCTAKRGLGNII